MTFVARREGLLSGLREIARAKTLIDYEAARRARAQLQTMLAYRDWGDAALENGWSSVGGATAAYWRDKWAYIRLKGVVDHAAFDLNTIFTLPEELRPLRHTYGHVIYRRDQVISTVNVSFYHPAVISIAPTGIVKVFGYYSTVGSLIWLSLDGISFRAANAGALS